MALKFDVKVPINGTVELGAWLLLPEGDGSPAITMAYGFTRTKEHGLERFARHSRPPLLCLFTIIVISERTAGTSFRGASRHVGRRSSVATSPSPPPSASRRRSNSIPNGFRKASGKTR
jgi:hypothetical protein